MHEQYRPAERALKLAQGRDLVGRVLVDVVQPDEGIEHQHVRPQSSHGLAQRVSVELKMRELLSVALLIIDDFGLDGMDVTASHGAAS
jgi:hypothetical protein